MTETGRSRVQSDLLRGILFMVAASCVLGTMNAMVKYLGSHYPIPMVMWARTTGHLLFVILLFAPQFGWGLARSARPVTQYARSALNLASIACFFTGVALIPLANASAITFTAPFIVTALSVPLLGEKVGPRRWAAVVVGFIGATIIIRPGSDVFQIESILIVASAGLNAMYQILTRKVAGVDRPETSVYFSAVLGAVVMTVLLPFFWQAPRAVVDVVLFLSTGVLGGVGHYLVARAFAGGPAALISPFSYSNLLIAVTLGYVVFGHFPDLWTWVGAVVIVASGLYIAYRETVRRSGITRSTTPTT